MEIKTERIRKIVVVISGASGSIYGIRLLNHLLPNPIEVHLIISRAGEAVLRHESDFSGGSFKRFLKAGGTDFHGKGRLIVHNSKNLHASPASGSFKHDGMVIAPCSMKTLAGIAAGYAPDLIGRAADVTLKERRPLILLTRETPLSLIHIENMAKATRAGAVIMPPCPGFYHQPITMVDLADSVIARVLDHLKIEQNIVEQWGEDEDLEEEADDL